MNNPLFTATKAHERALKLIALFDDEPDVLSPNEQALVMEIEAMQRQAADDHEPLEQQPEFQTKVAAAMRRLTNWR